jgi:hypothetical protein
MTVTLIWPGYCISSSIRRADIGLYNTISDYTHVGLAKGNADDISDATSELLPVIALPA